MVPATEYNLNLPIIVGTNVLRNISPDVPDLPEAWKSATLVAHTNAPFGVVKSTNTRPIELKPLETITLTELVRKSGNASDAVMEPSEL